MNMDYRGSTDRGIANSVLVTKVKVVCNNELYNHKNDWLCLNRQRLLESIEVYEI